MSLLNIREKQILDYNFLLFIYFKYTQAQVLVLKKIIN